METRLVATAGQSVKSQDGQHTQSFDRPIKHTSPNKKLIHKKSLFRLAGEFFKPTKTEKVENSTLDSGKQERVRVPWNSFVSLRGLRDGKKRNADYGTARCRSSSPQKSDVSVDEFGTKKAMRRKSLQDLLGTMGNRLSLGSRLAYCEVSIAQNEVPVESMKEVLETSHLALPEPALPLPGETTAITGSLLRCSEVSTSYEAAESQGKIESPQGNAEASSAPTYLRTKSSHRVLRITQPTDALDQSKSTEVNRPSQGPKQTSPSLSPERPGPALPTKNLGRVNPQLSTHVRYCNAPIDLPTNPTTFTEGKDPRKNNESDFEIPISPEHPNVDPSFPERALFMKARYNSFHDGTSFRQTELSTKDTENHVALTAAKIPGNLHLLTNESMWSMDSSETDTDDTSNCNWVENETKVQDIIDRGREIMTLGTLSPNLHSSNLSKFSTIATTTIPIMDGSQEATEVGALPPRYDSQVRLERCPNDSKDWLSSASDIMQPMDLKAQLMELSVTGSSSMNGDSLQGSDEDKPPTINCKVSRGRKQVISLVNGERFRPRHADSRLVSGEPIHIVYPPTEFSTAHTKTYLSKSSAFGDLYQNQSGLSDYCQFDRSTRTYYPQALSDPVPQLLQPNDKNLEVVWLPSGIFPADSFACEADKEHGCASHSNENVSELDGKSSYNAIGVPNSASGPLQVLEVEIRSSSRGKSKASDSSRHDSAYSQEGAWVGYTECAPHADIFGMSHSNYTTTLINTRELPNSAEGSFVSEDFQLEGDNMDDSYEMAVDSSTARLYLGSLFSSTESLRSIIGAESSGSNSTNSQIRKLKEIQSEDAKHVKTWGEMEHEFLNRFAPGSQMFPYRRRQVAVYEAFKKLKGCTESSIREDALKSDSSDSGFQDAPETESEKWLRFREAYMEFSFERAEDITKCEAILKQPDAITDVRDKGREIVVGRNSAFVPLLDLATFRDRYGRTTRGQRVARHELAAANKSPNLCGDGIDICPLSNIVTPGIHSKLGSESDSDTDSIAITMLSGYMFTHYAEQLGECPAEPHSDEKHCCEEGCGDQLVFAPVSDRATDVAPKFSDFENDTSSPPTELPEIYAGVGSNSGQLSLQPETGNIGLPRAITVQVCPPPARVGVATLSPERFTSMDVVDSTSAEASSGPSSPRPSLTIGKRILTPKKRIPSPLTVQAYQTSSRIRCTSPSPSDADTEVSETFGLKLSRYERIDEENKENDLWWTDSISYG